MRGDAPLLAADRCVLEATFEGVPADELAARVARRGRAVLADGDGHLAADEVERERYRMARASAAIALLRFELVTERARRVEALDSERATYERHLELEKDVIPPLKLKAKRLIAEIRILESAARELGIDVDAIAPEVDWPNATAVDDYEPTRYESNAERRRTAVEFFRRVSGR
jgi:hypothetical protein